LFLFHLVLPRKMANSAIHAIAGAAGGVIAMGATYPLIFLSTRSAVGTKAKKKSTYRAVVDIIKCQGVLGLYDGFNSGLLGIAVTNGVYYYFYEHSREIILRVRSESGSKALSTLESILIGLIAGSAATIISNPVWVVQMSQTVQTLDIPSEQQVITERLGFFDTVKSIFLKDGLGAFLRGIGPGLVLVVNPIIQYTIFEQLKNVLIQRRTARFRTATGATHVLAVLSDWDFFLLGAISKLVATGLTFPYIVIKSRLQAGSPNASKYKSSLDGLRRILREEGIEGLYKGISNKLLQSVLTAAILFAVQRRIFEFTKSYITLFSRFRKGSRAIIKCQ